MAKKSKHNPQGDDDVERGYREHQKKHEKKNNKKKDRSGGTVIKGHTGPVRG